MKFRYAGAVLAGAVGGVAIEGHADVVLFDTGPGRLVAYDPNNTGNHSSRFLGWASGDLGPGMGQRWSAQPFTISGGSWDLTRIHANYFYAEAPDRIGIRIWERNGLEAPTVADELFIGDVEPPTLLPDPRIPQQQEYLAILDVSSLSITLPTGDYYLSLYGIDNSGGNRRIAWLANPENTLKFVDPATNLPFMWRSEQYPSPGFEVFNRPWTTLMQIPGYDARDLYGAAFTLYGIPSPGALWLLGLASVFAMRRRR